MDFENENNTLKKIINSERHIVVRIGWTENMLCSTWAAQDYNENYIKSLVANKNVGEVHGHHGNHWLNIIGVFPITEEQVSDFMNEYTDTLIALSEEPTELVTYAKTIPSEYLEQVLFNKNQHIHSRTFNVFSHANSYQRALENKRICVITSFPETIKQQLSKLESLFDDKRLANLKPENITFIKSPPHKFISNEQENPYSTWNDAVYDMKEQLSKANSKYDVLITGCGAFSLPLTYHAYNHNKVAISLGGDLQLMFGIKGKRWVDDGYPFNDNWIYPLDSEKPENRARVENGAYW